MALLAAPSSSSKETLGTAANGATQESIAESAKQKKAAKGKYKDKGKVKGKHTYKGKDKKKFKSPTCVAAALRQPQPEPPNESSRRGNL